MANVSNLGPPEIETRASGVALPGVVDQSGAAGINVLTTGVEGVTKVGEEVIKSNFRNITGETTREFLKEKEEFNKAQLHEDAINDAIANNTTPGSEHILRAAAAHFQKIQRAALQGQISGGNLQTRLRSKAREFMSRYPAFRSEFAEIANAALTGTSFDDVLAEAQAQQAFDKELHEVALKLGVDPTTTTGREIALRYIRQMQLQKMQTGSLAIENQQLQLDAANGEAYEKAALAQAATSASSITLPLMRQIGIEMNAQLGTDKNTLVTPEQVREVTRMARLRLEPQLTQFTIAANQAYSDNKFGKQIDISSVVDKERTRVTKWLDDLEKWADTRGNMPLGEMEAFFKVESSMTLMRLPSMFRLAATIKGENFKPVIEVLSRNLLNPQWVAATIASAKAAGRPILAGVLEQGGDFSEQVLQVLLTSGSGLGFKDLSEGEQRTIVDMAEVSGQEGMIINGKPIYKFGTSEARKELVDNTVSITEKVLERSDESGVKLATALADVTLLLGQVPLGEDRKAAAQRAKALVSRAQSRILPSLRNLNETLVWDSKEMTLDLRESATETEAVFPAAQKVRITNSVATLQEILRMHALFPEVRDVYGATPESLIEALNSAGIQIEIR